MVLKKFLNDGTKKIPWWWYQKSYLMMELRRFCSDGTETSSLKMELKTLHGDGTKKVPWLHWQSSTGWY